MILSGGEGAANLPLFFGWPPPVTIPASGELATAGGGKIALIFELLG